VAHLGPSEVAKLMYRLPLYSFFSFLMIYLERDRPGWATKYVRFYRCDAGPSPSQASNGGWATSPPGRPLDSDNALTVAGVPLSRAASHALEVGNDV
jgi:hypothetical protein